MYLTSVRPLYERTGPWASVVLDVSGARPNAAPVIEARWRDLRRDLETAGADAATLDALDAAVVGPAEGHAGRALFAADGTVGWATSLPEPPPRDMAEWAALPRVAPALGARGELVRWVRADVDRTGGTVTTSGGGEIHVNEDAYPVTKVHAGGWSMPRYQRAAEENWDRAGRDVADVLTGLAGRTQADVLVLSGDVRARGLVAGRLPVDLADRTVEVDHESPGGPGPDPELDAATRAAIVQVARDRRARVFDRFHAGLADGHSIRGLAAVCDAAQQRAIEVLLIGPGADRREVWVDPADATMVGTAKRAVLTGEPVPATADDALVGAAALADAELYVADGPALVDGVGAILRHVR